MAIHEKNKVIEFSYEDESIGNENGREIVGYDMVYDGTNPLTPLRIAQRGSVNGLLFCHPSLLVEIVDFLRNKGVIQSQVNIRDLANVSRGLSTGQGIPLPVITKKDGSETSRSDLPPIASFDVNAEANEEKELDSSSDIVGKKSPSTEGVVVVAGQGISKESEKMMKERPVIKSRVKDAENDPLEAEREAASKRKSMKKNTKGLRRIE